MKGNAMKFVEAVEAMNQGQSVSRESWVPGSSVRLERLIYRDTIAVDVFLASRPGWHDDPWAPTAQDMLVEDWFIVEAAAADA